MSDRFERATLGGGCFWCLEAVYDEVDGVEQVVSGYAGGHVRNPSYREVITGETGHAEVVQITFDPTMISYRHLLEIYFTIHDPTQLNRQGADVGSQYRSVIFYHTENQKQDAERIIEEMEDEGVWDDPIVTELVPYEAFYEAETYHQDYYENNPQQPYCQVIIRPKLAQYRETFLEKRTG